MSNPGPDIENAQNAVKTLVPDLDLFYEIKSIKKMRSHQLVEPSTNAPLYTIHEHETTFTRNKPDIRLYAGPEKTHPLVGVTKFGPGLAREHKIGLGDPNCLISEDGTGERMIWESMRRPEKDKWYFHRFYTFEYGDWQARKAYTWKRPTDRWPNHVGVLELRVGGPDDADGELLAKWICRSRWTQKYGSLYIKRIEGEADEKKRWEHLVILSCQSIIEAAVRRAK